MLDTSRYLTLIGLSLTMIGAALLFFYGVPKKKIGNVILDGRIAMTFEPNSVERDVPPAEWQPKLDALIKRATWLNRVGFALVTVGTAFQLVGTWIGDAPR